GLSRFSKKLHSTISFTDDPRLKYPMIKDLLADNEQFWLATQDGVLIYNPGNNTWRNFQEEINLPSRSVNTISFSQNKRWFATNEGVAVFDEANKIWQRYDQTHGLTSEVYQEIAAFKGFTFLINENSIDYFKPLENRWYNYALKDIATMSDDKTRFISLDKEKGSFVQFSPDVRFSLSGTRFTFRHQRKYDYQFDSQHSAASAENINRGDFKVQLSLPKDRTVNGFYNNTDFSQVLYGVRYKGIKGDLIQEINWGDVSYKQGEKNLVPSIGVFGSSARIEAGPKTKKKYRSFVSAKGWSGEKTTDFESDFFKGNLKSGRTSVRDVDYVKNIYFRIDTTGVTFSIDRGSEQIYLDDGNPANNSANTLVNYSIAGVIGDFDLLHPMLDYVMDDEQGVIKFLAPVSDAATIIVTGVSRGIYFERFIYTPNRNSHHLVNRYFINGMEIIPHSFSMRIVDQFGTQQSLADFGLDANHDGLVDPEWIDYNQGVLTFPDLKPFPAAVYNRDDSASSYQLQFSFETEITIFNLGHNQLVRESEVVIVDGEILTRGEDYVLDYTSGTLLIVKEGIVAEDSEIQVNYEYYRNTREKFHLAGVGLGISDNALIEVNYFGFDKEKQKGDLERFDGLNVFSELKWRVKNFDFKFTPEFARNQGAAQQGNSMHLKTDVSSEKMRLFSQFERYDGGFQPLFKREFQLGKIY
ncbi:MAG: hypothetical protein JSW07_08830, partial [bacterium]